VSGRGDPSDRIVTVPRSFDCPLVQGGKYTFADCLGELAWPSEKWSADGWDVAQVRIGEAVDALDALKGGALRLGLGDWEKLREVCKAAKPIGKYAPKLRAMLVAVITAEKPTEARGK
jgi:hypothetical protein